MSPEMYDFFLTNEGNKGIHHQDSLYFEDFFDHDLLPRGSDKELQFFDFDPKHISTKCFENCIFDMIMKHQDEIIG